MHKLCVEAEESKRLMEAIHGGECGAHMNGVMLARKISDRVTTGPPWSRIVSVLCGDATNVRSMQTV